MANYFFRVSDESDLVSEEFENFAAAQKNAVELLADMLQEEADAWATKLYSVEVLDDERRLVYTVTCHIK